jgi:Rab GDP dissociation inhibitor
MLNQDISKINLEGGKVSSVEGMFEGKMGNAKAKYVIASPSYIQNVGMGDKLKKTGKIIRVICIMDHPIKGIKKGMNSVQIIIPQKQAKRKNDIYIMQVSEFHKVCKKGFYIAIISTIIETNNPESELKLAYDLIGPVLHKFTTTEDILQPISSAFTDNVFITNTLDPTSHFESAANNVLDIYKKITGKDLDLENLPEDPTE